MRWFGHQVEIKIVETQDALDIAAVGQRRVADLFAPCLTIVLLGLVALAGELPAWCASVGAALAILWACVYRPGDSAVHITRDGFTSAGTFYSWSDFTKLAYSPGTRSTPSSLAAIQSYSSNLPLLQYVDQGQCQSVIDAIHLKFPEIEFDTKSDGFGKMVHEVIDLLHPKTPTD